MVIEVAGPPGAGKTTLVEAVLDGCRSAGLQPYTVVEAARVFARRTLAGRAVATLPPQLARRGLWGVYRMGSALGAARLAASHPALTRYVVASQWRRPRAAATASRQVLYWYYRTAGDYAFLRAKGRPHEVLVVDEGFVHRAVQLHASTVERPTSRAVATYVRLLPAFDLLVAVHAPVAVCADRVRARGVWPRMRQRAHELDRFVASAHDAAELAVAAARHQGRRVVDVDNDDDLQVSRRVLIQELQRAIAVTDTRGRPTSARPSVCLPRPTQAVRTLSARWQQPAIDAETCRTVVARYGLSVLGSPRNVAFGARNSNVVVDTTSGRAVLRRYRPTSPPATVRHEHDVLAALERCGFPAVRTVRTGSDGTVVDHAGELYALFRFEDGANVSSCVLTPSSRRRLVGVAAHQLARMHEALRDFRPRSPHHLSFGDGGEELDWYLAALDRVSSVDPDPEVRRDHLALLERRDDVATRILRLHGVLQEAGLPRTIVHGDYGLHNVLFRRDGTTVVTDFELARRDWRLIDLVVVLSRMRPDDGKAFVDAYGHRTTISDHEWRHLPDVWEYYRLTGAIRSWHGYLLHGGPQRVSNAVARLAEARRVAEGSLVP